MKTFSGGMGTLLLILCGMLINASAMAQHHSHKHGHRHGPAVHFGFSYGPPIYAPRYFPEPFYTFHGYAVPAPVYAYPPAVIRYVPSSPAYVERSIAPAESDPSQAQNDWYYCSSSRMYYPYAKECPSGWQRVPAQPPSQ